MQKTERRLRLQGRGAQGAQKLAGCQRVQGPPPTVIARSGATWQSASLRQHAMKSNTLGESEKHYEFALRIANLQSFSAGTRIAAPVCALVRNDNRGAWVRIRPRQCQLARLLCGENGLPHQCAHWFAMTCRRRAGVCGCKDVICNNMQRGARCLRVQGRGSPWHAKDGSAGAMTHR